MCDSPQRNIYMIFPVLDTQMRMGAENRLMGVPREVNEGKEIGFKEGVLHKVILFNSTGNPWPERHQ